MAAKDYGVGIQYSSLLLFHDHTYWDLKDPNGWEMYGTYKPMSGTGAYLRRDGITHDIPWFAARCDVEKSKFDGEDHVYTTNNAFSSIAPGGYLYHRNYISINYEYATMGCWFKIRSVDANEFYGSDKYHITLFTWTNHDNVDIHVEIRARDDTNKLIECIKVFYGSKYYQAYLPEPILNDTWYYFAYAVDYESDTFYINGVKFLEVTNTRTSSTPVVFKKIYIGAHDNWSSGGLTIDEFMIINDFILNGDKWKPTKPIFWIRPEMLHLEDLSEEKNLYYQMGSTLRLDYILNSPSLITSPDTLEFSYVQGYPLALFRDSTKLDPSDWTGNVREIKLLRAADKAVIHTAKFVLVTVVKFIPDNDSVKVNGASLYDHMLHPIRITRISYYKAPGDAETNMFNKILWYQNNKIPGSDFKYIDKFGVQFKE